MKVTNRFLSTDSRLMEHEPMVYNAMASDLGLPPGQIFKTVKIDNCELIMIKELTQNGEIVGWDYIHMNDLKEVMMRLTIWND